MRTKALSWGFVRVSVGFWVWVLVLGGGDEFCKRVENSLRGERFGDLNSRDPDPLHFYLKWRVSS